MSKAAWALTIGIGLAVLLSARRRAAAGEPLLMNPASRNINDNVASANQNAAFWAIQSGGNPSIPGQTNARGIVTPATAALWSRPGGNFGGNAGVWKAPNAGVTAVSMQPLAPRGMITRLGPVPPGAPTPQSAVQSSSPWLPTDLRLVAPLAANPWYYELSRSNPFIALAAGSGGYIDVARMSAPPGVMENS